MKTSTIVRKMINATNTEDLESLIKNGKLDPKEIACVLGDMAKDGKLYWVDADRIMDKIVEIKGLKACAGALGAYSAGMIRTREYQEHVRKYNFDLNEYCKKKPEPSKKEFAKESLRQEKNGNLEDAAFLARCANDFARSFNLYEQIINDETRTCAERAHTAEIDAVLAAEEAVDHKRVENFYKAAIELYIRAAKEGESSENRTDTPNVVRNVISTLCEQDYDASHFYFRAAKCAEDIFDYALAAKLMGLSDKSEQVFDVEFDWGSILTK
jgi:hypothetical protein